MVDAMKSIHAALKIRVHAAAIEDRVRVEHSLQAPMQSEDRCGQRMEHAHALVAAAKQYRVATVLLRERAHALRRCLLADDQPAQRATPFDHLVTTKIGVWCRGFHGDTP